MDRRPGILLLAMLAQAAAAAGQHIDHATVPSLEVIRTHSPVAIDGQLDEDVWTRAPAASTFIQRDPDEGQPATELTELRMAYDDAALYVAVRLHDREPARIARQRSRRDDHAESDWFAIALDPRHDHLTGAMFRVTAAGVQGDSTIYNDTFTDASWDAVWASAVSVDEEGWTVEMRIPFSQLRFPAAERHTFGINATRHIQRKSEQAWLVHVPKTERALASRMGHAVGLENVPSRRTVEVLPYVVSRAEFIAPASARDPFNDGALLFGGAGLDLKYRLTSSLTVDGTINPDFGQVEVDPAVVNLTAFETFFQEKRPFFTEGASIFSGFGRSGANNFWGFNRSEPLLFYSRRIGRPPQGLASGEFVSRPAASTILGAAKLTGKTRNGWNIGLLDAVTGREHARTQTDGVASAVPVEPLTNYLVARVQRESRRAAAGVLTTIVTRDLAAGTLADALPGRSVVMGADGHYFFDDRREWVVTGRIARSHVSGSSTAIGRLQRAPQRYFQRPDAPHIALDQTATAMSGWTGSLNLNRNSGIHGVNAALWAVSPGFDSSDAGFSFNSDRAGAHLVYSWNNPKLTRVARARSFSIAKWYTWNFARVVQGDGLHAFGRIQFLNYWTIYAGAFGSRAILDDRATRGGPTMVRPAYGGGFLGLGSDSRKRVSLEANSEAAFGEDGGRSVSAGLDVRYRPVAWLDLSTGPSVSTRRMPAQYVGRFADPSAIETSGARYVFANLHQTELSFSTRVNLVLSPKLSVQVYMQPLVSAGDYATFKELTRPRSYDFTRYGIDAGRIEYEPQSRRYTVHRPGAAPFQFSDPDFNFKSLRLNAILRWEWRPGSAMYVVWTENREDFSHPGQFLFGRDFGRMFAAPADDVLMFKLTYWLSR